MGYCFSQVRPEAVEILNARKGMGGEETPCGIVQQLERALGAKA